jgi:hypothetical protein
VVESSTGSVVVVAVVDERAVVDAGVEDVLLGVVLLDVPGVEVSTPSDDEHAAMRNPITTATTEKHRHLRTITTTLPAP